jgi:hypothetical protein
MKIATGAGPTLLAGQIIWGNHTVSLFHRIPGIIGFDAFPQDLDLSDHLVPQNGILDQGMRPVPDVNLAPAEIAAKHLRQYRPLLHLRQGVFLDFDLRRTDQRRNTTFHGVLSFLFNENPIPIDFS